MRPFGIINILFVALLILLDALYLYGIADWYWILVLIIIYIHLLVLGAVYIQWNFYLKSYNRGTADKLIALTFDDGPAGETERILDILKAQHVEAAFFAIGKRAVENAGIVKRWHDEGHVVGNHSYNHGFNFDWKSARNMAAEIEQTNTIVERITGKRPLLFRPPYGVTNPNVAKSVKLTGMHSIGWNIRSFDTSAKDAGVLKQRILSGLKGGDIILLHDSMPITAEILTDLIVQARQKGFTFARVDKLLGLQPYA